LLMNETPRAADRGAVGAASTEGSPSKGRLSILVVEDEAIVAQDLCEFLRELEHDVVGVATRGRDAVQLAAQLSPDLIVMDVRLRGDMDGIQTAEAIHRQLHVPVIFLTGQTDAETLNRAVSTGPMAYLVKPFKDAELRGAIEIAILKHQAELERMAREDALRRNAEAMLTLSLVDELTQLKNRRGFFALAEQELKVAHREHQSVVIFFVDLNGLKQINDEFGHPAGDQALQDAAMVLLQTFRESDIVARLGGDEFVVLARSNDHDVVMSVRARLKDQINAFNTRFSRPYILDMSIGAAPVEESEVHDIDALLARADAAMYEDKKRARSQAAPYRARS
jgi:diguanylate cyclase (GGDEF)-like protein